MSVLHLTFKQELNSNLILVMDCIVWNVPQKEVEFDRLVLSPPPSPSIGVGILVLKNKLPLFLGFLQRSPVSQAAQDGHCFADVIRSFCIPATSSDNPRDCSIHRRRAA